MKATYSFGECVSRAIGLVHAIISGNCPDKVIDLGSRKEVDFNAPDWSNGRFFIEKVEADDEESIPFFGCHQIYNIRKIKFWMGDNLHKHLATVVMGQEYLDGDEVSGWTKWKVEEFHYRDFSSEEWTQVTFSRKKRELTSENFNSRPWVATVGC